MQKYIGTKTILALPMTRAGYNAYRGWTTPPEEEGADEGYLVEYTDGSKGNHPSHRGYITWSPKEVFDKAYRITSAMTFGDAIVMLKAGLRVARAGWNGKGMWLQMVPADAYKIPGLTEQSRQQPFGLDLQPFIGMKTAQDMFVPWLASQSDMLGEDWSVV